LNQLPPNVKLTLLRKAPASKNKGKQICDDDQAGSNKQKIGPIQNCLTTLDIFAGCGGLSEGLQQSGTHFSYGYLLMGTPSVPHF
jgi:DNA (cytosine-5)-methyltransferase 1